MNGSRIVLRRAVMAAIIVAALVVAAWFALRTSSRSIRLRDGREFTIHAVTYGTQHRLDLGPRWLNPVARVLPPARRQRLGTQTFAFATDAPSLVVWGSWTQAPSTNQWVLRASVSDRTGCETEPASPAFMSYAGGGRILMAWGFSNFPREQSRVDIGLYAIADPYRPRWLARVAVDNPAGTNPKPWQAAALPVTLRHGSSEFSLTRLGTWPPAPRAASEAPEYRRCWGTAFFRVTRNGVADPGWAVEGVELDDALGNRAVVKPVHLQRVGEEWFCLFTEPMWPEATAVKVTAEFARLSGFESNEVFTVPAMKMPTNDTPVQALLPEQPLGISVALELKRAEGISAGTAAGIPASHSLSLTPMPPAKGTRLRLLGATDERGGEVVRRLADSNQRSDLYWLRVPANAGELTLKIAVAKGFVAEFVAKPQRNPGD